MAGYALYTPPPVEQTRRRDNYGGQIDLANGDIEGVHLYVLFIADVEKLSGCRALSTSIA